MMYHKEIEIGNTAQSIFEEMAKRHGFDAIPSSKTQDIYDHIDVFLRKNKIVFSFDIKAKKKINRSDEESQDECVFVEFRNVRGHEGWLYGKANFIAFETNDSFVIVSRKKLLEFCEEKVIKKYVLSPAEALYRLYRRVNRQDCISLIRLSDLPKEICTVWPKNGGLAHLVEH